MIWIYFLALLWGVFLLISAIRVGKKDINYRDEAELTFWMMPVVATGLICIILGGLSVVYETGRIYGGW